MNQHQLENRSLRIKRETKSPTLQKRAKSLASMKSIAMPVQ